MSEREGNGSTRTDDRPGPRGADRGQQPEAFARSGAEPPPPPPRRPFYKRPLVLLIGGLLIIGGIIVGILWWLHARQFQSTDDAFIDADITQVSPRVAGHVLGVQAKDNQDVPQQFELVTLDPQEFETRVAQAQAAVLAAEATVRQAQDNAVVVEADVGQAEAAQVAAETEARRAHDELARFENLPPGATTQQQVNNFRAAAQSADAQVEAARKKTAAAQAQVRLSQSQIAVAQAQVDQARAQLKQANLQLGYTHINAPIAGTVTNRSVEVGDYVQVGQALLALVPHEVYVTANYKETQLTDMRPGQDVDITVDAYPGHVFHGKVDSIERGSGARFSLLPPENATGNYVKVVQRVPVKILFNSDGYRMGPGMSVVPRVKVR